MASAQQYISINLLVVYRESLNLIGYITRRLSADSLRQDSCSRDCIRDPLSNLNQYTWREWRATFEPLNMKDNETVLFYALLDICFLLCNETTSKFILNQLDYSPSFSTSDS